ncbi:MAG: hypothetical protein ACPGQV_20380, partial [Alphaproteobacteria bacterium]
AEDSLKTGGLPIGLAYNVKLKQAIGKGEQIGWTDAEINETSEAYRIRREMEDTFALSNAGPTDNDWRAFVPRPQDVLCCRLLRYKI